MSHVSQLNAPETPKIQAQNLNKFSINLICQVISHFHPARPSVAKDTY